MKITVIKRTNGKTAYSDRPCPWLVDVMSAKN
jgi:hypothetical protein